MACNNDSFTMLDDIIRMYCSGLLSVSEATNKFMTAVEQYTWFINDTDIRIKAENILYKRFFYKMHKAILRMEKQ